MKSFGFVLEKYCLYMSFATFWIAITGGKGFVAQCEMTVVNVLILYIIHKSIWRDVLKGRKQLEGDDYIEKNLYFSGILDDNVFNFGLCHVSNLSKW